MNNEPAFPCSVCGELAVSRIEVAFHKAVMRQALEALNNLDGTEFPEQTAAIKALEDALK